MRKPVDYGRLPTEQNNPRTRQIDRLSTDRALRLIHREDVSAARAVGAALPRIAKAVEAIVSSLQSGGRLRLFGAGTSGRLAILEAAECPPTFNTPPSLVRAVMAGGRSSVFRSKEGAEDRADDGAAAAKREVRPGDVAIGIAASGVTPFVRAALGAARSRGAATVFVTCHAGADSRLADHVIAVRTGPEVIAGSTRLKAGTATKLVLNMLTVASLVRLGKVYGNRMVDLQPRSAKLRDRATRLVSELGRVAPRRAAVLLRGAGGRAKTAIVMARLGVSKSEAERRLRQVSGHLHRLLDGAS